MAVEQTKGRRTVEAHALITHQEVSTTFQGIYYVESAFVKKTVQGKDYTDFTLRDRSGSRSVKYWGVIDGAVKGSWVAIDANVELYLSNPSVIAKRVKLQAEAPLDLSDYIPAYEDSEKNAARFDAIRAALAECEKRSGGEIAGLMVDEVYKNQSFFAKFVVSPGSGRPHYGRQGGLLANIVRVAEACLNGADRYALNDQEKTVLLASALLCRIGAIEAFEFKDCMPVVTKKGILMGINNLTMSRVMSALRRATQALAKDGKQLDHETFNRVLHAVASHDSTCVKPMTKEAMVLSAAFTTDAQIVDALDFIEQDVNKTEEFTAYDSNTRRQYYVGVRTA